MNSHQPTISQIAQAFRERDDFVILTHMRPDGDATGSQLAVAHTLMALGKKVSLLSNDPVPERLAFLPGTRLIISSPLPAARDYGCIISLDCASRERIGEPLKALGQAPLWINIDHHATNPAYGDLNLIDPQAPATGQILFEAFRQGELPIPAPAADNLFAAIATDTGSFQYENTTARTYEIAAELVRIGVRVGDISRSLYDSMPRRQFELMRAALDATHFSDDGRIGWIVLPLARAEQIGALAEDTEGLIDLVRAVDSVIVAFFVEELPDERIRVSMRSKSPQVDVSKIATSLGGGGHRMAAGIRMSGPLNQATTTLLQAVQNEL
ncbi:MAG: bifunctional oligoribonuclease/PAP phosphatase NrnA [Verrucomicrobiales bacterium]